MNELIVEWMESLPAVLRDRHFESINYSYSEKNKIWSCIILYGLGKSCCGDGRNLEIASSRALEALDEQLRKETNVKS